MKCPSSKSFSEHVISFLLKNVNIWYNKNVPGTITSTRFECIDGINKRSDSDILCNSLKFPFISLIDNLYPCEILGL